MICSESVAINSLLPGCGEQAQMRIIKWQAPLAFSMSISIAFAWATSTANALSADEKVIVYSVCAIPANAVIKEEQLAERIIKSGKTQFDTVSCIKNAAGYQSAYGFQNGQIVEMSQLKACKTKFRQMNPTHVACPRKLVLWTRIDVAKGHLMTDSDLEVRPTVVSDCSASSLLVEDKIVGRKASRNISKGTRLTSQMF